MELSQEILELSQEILYWSLNDARCSYDFYDEHDVSLLVEIFDMASSDDKDGLVKLVQYHWERGIHVPEDLLHQVVLNGAVNSARALLRGEAGWKFDLNVPLSGGTFLLHHAASIYSLNLTDLFIRHGASTDVVTNGVRLIYNGLLPLNAALEKLRYHDYLVYWTPKDSIFKLITILCLPQMKVPLATTRLLAEHTKETKEEFYLYAKDGHPIQMAVLLMVARDIVLAPFPSLSDDGSNLDGGIMSIRRCIKDEIASLAAEEVNLTGKGRNSNPMRMLKDKKTGLHSALMLLDVFEKAGDAIDEYLQSKLSDKLSKDKVVEDVKSIFVKAGFNLKEKDTNLSNINWITYDGWSSDGDLTSKDFTTAASTGSQSLGHPLPTKSLQGNVPGKIDACEEKWAVKKFFPRWTPTLSHKIDVVGAAMSKTTTWGVNNRDESIIPLLRRHRAIKHTKATTPRLSNRLSSKRAKVTMPLMRHLPSTKHFATIAFTLIKGVKHL